MIAGAVWCESLEHDGMVYTRHQCRPVLECPDGRGQDGTTRRQTDAAVLIEAGCSSLSVERRPVLIVEGGDRKWT